LEDVTFQTLWNGLPLAPHAVGLANCGIGRRAKKKGPPGRLSIIPGNNPPKLGSGGVGVKLNTCRTFRRVLKTN